MDCLMFVMLRISFEKMWRVHAHVVREGNTGSLSHTCYSLELHNLVKDHFSTCDKRHGQKRSCSSPSRRETSWL